MDCANALLDKATSAGGAGTGVSLERILSFKPTGTDEGRSGSRTLLQTGDVVLCGPDKWGIHHVVLCRGETHHDSEMAAHLGLADDDLEVFSCNTIESSRPLKGAEVCWYPACTYYGRRRGSGEVVMVADMPEGGDTIELHEDQVPVKMLFHPLRPESGGPSFDAKAFWEAVDSSAVESRRWSVKTAVRALAARKERLEPSDYPDEESRAELMEDLRKRWGTRPICSSVAIQVWQRYFEIASQDAGPGAEDQAARAILRWMPLLCDQTTPSTLLKVLSGHGWVLKGRLQD